jgi:3-deoxy-7-phosphoheptulonate synthase
MRDVVHQIREGNRSVVGFMVESFIEPGNQPIPADLSKLRYGCSVTDACVGWDTTVEMLRRAREVLRELLPGRERPSI